MASLFPRPPRDRRPRAVVRPPKVATIFAVVPGIGTLEPEKWHDDTGESWLESMPEFITPGLAVFAFPHNISPSGNNLWAELLEKGFHFANDLLWLVKHEQLSHCPIVMVAHSLGGVIVKEALRIICEQNNIARSLLRTLSAIVLLGTPHSNVAADWKGFANILHTGKGSQKRRSMTSDEASDLVKSCTRFQDAHVPIPVISVYETRKTKIRNKIGFAFHQKTLLIEENSVLTKANEEHFIGLDADHRNLCNIEVHADGFTQLCDLLFICTTKAREKIVNGSPQYRAPSILDSWSEQDEDEANQLILSTERIELSDEPTSMDTPSFSDPRSMQVGSATSHPTQLDASGALNGELAVDDADIVFPVFMMPVAKSKDFFGREDVLASIESALLDEASSSTTPKDTPRAYAICGPGGIGKTQLAAEFVFRHRHKFDAVFWIHADRAAKIAEAFGKIAAELKLVEDNSPDARDPVVVRELVKGWLANAYKGARTTDENQPEIATWLIVFDSVDEPDELEDYWPLDGAGSVLFTGRDPFTREAPFLAGRGKNLAPFNLTEADQYLRKLTNRNEDGTKVVKILGGFPLAITQIGASIVRRGLSFDEFVVQYEEEESHLELFEKKQLVRGRNDSYEKSLASVWALEGLKYGAVLLNTLAFFDPDGIKERVLTEKPHEVPNPDYPRSSTMYFKAREELMQSSLVTKDKFAEKLVIHRLIQDAARSKMSVETYRLMFTTAVAVISSVWPYEAFGWRHEVARWRVCEELFPHVQRLADLSRWVQPPVGSVTGDLTLIKLLNDAAWYYHESGNNAHAGKIFSSAQKMAELLKSVSEISEDPADPAFFADLNLVLAEIHHNLGCVATEINSPQDALTHFQAFKDLVVSGNLKTTDQGDLKKSIAWNELGNAYMLNKDWLQGKECFDESIKANKALPNYDPTNMSFPMVNLGLSYWFTGDYPAAAATLREGLQHRETKYGKDDKESFITGRFLHALGNVLRSQGLLDESFEYHKRGLKHYFATLGKNHHRTGDMHVKVAEHHFQRKEYSEARVHLENALRVFRQREVLRHELCRALFKRSLVMEAEGLTSDAERDRKEAVELYNQLYPGLPKSTQAMNEAEIDEIVAFWSV